jgi:hypothetical protein
MPTTRACPGRTGPSMGATPAGGDAVPSRGRMVSEIEGYTVGSSMINVLPFLSPGEVAQIFP